MKRNRGNEFSKKIALALMTGVCIIALYGCKTSDKTSTGGDIQKEAQNGSQNEVLTEAVYSITEEGNGLISANAPISSYWLPDELLEWDYTQDPDAEYNKSVVPLAERIDKQSLETINSTQNKDTRVVALSIMNQSTSGNPSQGTNIFDSNTFSYYQYIDILVYWGGSAGEGIIVPPSPDVIDSAHTNGVPVLGTVFFPQTAHGGRMEWLNTALTKDENGDFPFAKKLVEAAEVYGFDGWFINQETEGTEEEPLTEEHSKLMQEFLIKIKEYCNDELEIMWYDSQTAEGKMDWQNTLNEKNDIFLVSGDQKLADSIFLNFWWYYKDYFEQELIKKAAEHAESIGFDPYEVYAGIDVQANGIEQPVRWFLLEKALNQTFTSLGIYCPSWTYFSSGSYEEFHEKENKFWVNEFGDPSIGTKAVDMEWRGISTYVTERSAVTKLPFYTDFNIGNGYNYFAKGEKISSLDWNNRGLADVMPTYRYLIKNEGSNKVLAGIDYSTAYNGGNSIRFLADMEAGKPSFIRLMQTDLTLTKDTVFEISARTDADIKIRTVLTLADGTTREIDADKAPLKDWDKLSFDMKELDGQVIRTISFELSSESGTNAAIFNLGGIYIYDKTDMTAISVNELTIEDTLFEEDDTIAGVRISWDQVVDPNFKNYEIYRVNSDGSKSFLGASKNNRFFVHALQRIKESDVTTFEVVAVNRNDVRGAGASASITWPDNTIPKANFKANKTIAAPGQEVSFTNMSNAVTESVKWEFEGADLAESTDENPVITYSKEGIYSVKLIASNEKGEDTKTVESLITITNAANDGLMNLSAGKETSASSYVNDGEAPEFAVDGVLSTKWCAVGPDQHNITIDLGDVKTIGEVKVYHAEAGGESDGMNTEEYRIEVSEDGEEFVTVAEVIKNSAGETTDAFKQIDGRYVRFTVLKATQGSDSAARIYEIEVFGLE